MLLLSHFTIFLALHVQLEAQSNMMFTTAMLSHVLANWEAIIKTGQSALSAMVQLLVEILNVQLAPLLVDILRQPLDVFTVLIFLDQLRQLILIATVASAKQTIFGM
jgi:hypothetical protein